MSKVALRTGLRALRWAVPLESILLLWFLNPKRGVGPHDPVGWFLALSQVPGLWMMSLLSPPPVESGGIWFNLYYLGAGLVQVLLLVGFTLLMRPKRDQT